MQKIVALLCCLFCLAAAGGCATNTAEAHRENAGRNTGSSATAAPPVEDRGYSDAMYGSDTGSWEEHVARVKGPKSPGILAQERFLNEFIQGIIDIPKDIAEAHAEYMATTTPEERQAHSSCMAKCDADYKGLLAICQGYTDQDEGFITPSSRRRCKSEAWSARDSCYYSCR